MNLSNTSDCKVLEPESSTSISLKVSAVVLVSVLGIFGNVFIIILAWKYTVRKNLHHLIINMAVSDSMFIVAMSFFSAQHLSDRSFSFYPGGTFGLILCKMSFFLLYVSCPVSFATLLAISIERFRVTRTQMHRCRPYTSQQRYAVLLGTWLLPTGLFAFVLHFAKLGTTDSGVNVCRMPSSYYRYTLLIFFVNHHLIILIFVVIFTLSTLTIRRLSKAKSFKATFNKKQQKQRTNRIRSAVYMVLCSVILSSICWIPYFIYSSLFYLQYLAGKGPLVSSCLDVASLHFITVYLLPLGNSAFGPGIYIIFLGDFREAAGKVLCGKTGSLRVNSGSNSFELQQFTSPRKRRGFDRDKNTTFSSIATNS